MLLSLVCNSSSTTSDSGAESTPPRTATDPSAGATPLRLRPVTAMFRACSNRMNWRAADWLGLNPIVLSANVRPSLTISASYGPASAPQDVLRSPRLHDELVVVAAAVADDVTDDLGDSRRVRGHRRAHRVTSC